MKPWQTWLPKEKPSRQRVKTTQFDVFAWEVSVEGTDWRRVINARTRGQAKAIYYHDVREAYPDILYTDIRCRKLGDPQTDTTFARVAIARGLPDIKCGQRVRVGESRGVIVGSNSSMNFDVLFDNNAPKYAGLRLNCHPDNIRFEEE
ncbi:MAG: hypothetical protein WC551_11575 [Patescibacteria group bacterium]